MLNRKRLLIILMTLFAVPIIVWVAFAYGLDFNVSFTETSGTCSLSGTYTKKIYADGTYEWSPYAPSSATLSLSETAERLGNASVTLVSGYVNFSPADERITGCRRVSV